MADIHPTPGQDPLGEVGSPITAGAFTADQVQETAEWWGELNGD